MNRVDWKNTPGACRMIDEFNMLEVVGSGTYGVVYKAIEKKLELGDKPKQYVALKEIRMDKERDGLPITTAREIKLLSRLHHPNIVSLKDVAVGPSGNQFFLVFEYLDHDLETLLDDYISKTSNPLPNSKSLSNRKILFGPSEIKSIVFQLLSAVDYLHTHWVVHRDIKMANLLYNIQTGQLKLADFGLARTVCNFYGEPLTPHVVTLWYRAPELLFQDDPEYGMAVDLWSVGCIFGELFHKRPIFPGKSQLDQLQLMAQLLGTNVVDVTKKYCPKGIDLMSSFEGSKRTMKRHGMIDEMFRGLGENGLDLLTQLLHPDRWKRISAHDALMHPYFL